MNLKGERAMPAATRKGDSCTGHDLCPPVSLVEGSPDVKINGRAAGRMGDRYAPHGCVTHSSHQDVIASGSGSVFINGKPAARIGDAVSTGGAVQGGSSDVFIGG